jgi:DNA-binding protein HU-beta
LRASADGTRRRARRCNLRCDARNRGGALRIESSNGAIAATQSVARKIFLSARNFLSARIEFAWRSDYDSRSFCARRECEAMRSVTKADLVEAAARAGNLSKSSAGEAVNAVFDAIVASVAKGNRVTVIGFGTFLPRRRKARAGRSPLNGKEIRISSKTVPAFAAGQGFKDRVANR